MKKFYRSVILSWNIKGEKTNLEMENKYELIIINYNKNWLQDGNELIIL